MLPTWDFPIQEIKFYGINITRSMAGLKGVAHIADDLVVHGGRNLTRI